MRGLKRFVAGAYAFMRQERGDQNVGHLGLIVVTIAIIGLLMTKLAGPNGAFSSILDSVIQKLKDALGI